MERRESTYSACEWLKELGMSVSTAREAGGKKHQCKTVTGPPFVCHGCKSRPLSSIEKKGARERLVSLVQRTLNFCWMPHL